MNLDALAVTSLLGGVAFTLLIDLWLYRVYGFDGTITCRTQRTPWMAFVMGLLMGLLTGHLWL